MANIQKYSEIFVPKIIKLW